MAKQSDKLNLSLDDIIDKQSSRGGGRGGGRRGGGGGRGRGGSGSAPRSTMDIANPLARDDEPRYSRQEDRSAPFRQSRSQIQDDDAPWQHDRHEGVASAAGGPKLVPEGKVIVSNLDPSMTESEIKELFRAQSNIVASNVTLNYNKQGESIGTCEVSFRNKADAERAAKELDRALIDDREMRVQVVAQVLNVPTPRTVQKRAPVYEPVYQQRAPRAYAPPQPRQFNGQQRQPRSNGASRGSSRGAPRGRGAAGGRGGGRGGAARKTPATLESLDAEMDAYHQTAGAAGAAPASSPAAAGVTGQP